jgi:hypothetical protein
VREREAYLGLAEEQDERRNQIVICALAFAHQSVRQAREICLEDPKDQRVRG